MIFTLYSQYCSDLSKRRLGPVSTFLTCLSGCNPLPDLLPAICGAERLAPGGPCACYLDQVRTPFVLEPLQK